MNPILVSVLCSVGLAGCAEATAATVDASRDVDCSVVAFYFDRIASQQGADPANQRALNDVHKWYSRKVQTVAKAEGTPTVLDRAGPILELVKKDPTSMTDELSACTDRALAEGLR